MSPILVGERGSLTAWVLSSLSVKYIAAFMVCATCTIHRRARRLGIVFDEKHLWTPAEDAVLRARYADEQTEAIARDLGLGIGRVYQRARKLGLAKSAAFYASDKSKRIQRGKQNPAMIASRFPKGHVPANKGMRRPGPAGRLAAWRPPSSRRAGRLRRHATTCPSVPRSTTANAR